MRNKELADNLNKWFLSQTNRNKNFWTQNKVAKVIKSNLIQWDNFKKKGKNSLDF